MASKRAVQKNSKLLQLMMLVAAAYFLIPLFWLVVASTKSMSSLYNSFGMWFASPFSLFENVHKVFTLSDGIFLHWAKNSIVYAVGGALGAAIISTLTGYGFSKYRFRGSNLLFGLVLVTIMVPTTALALPTYLMFVKFHLVNTTWAVILPSLVSPIGVYLMRVYCASAVPQTLLEAGRIDGAGEFRIFRDISVRMLAPGFVTVLLLSIIGVWNNYLLPLMMVSVAELQPLTVGLSVWNLQANAGGGFVDGSMPVVLITASLITVIPLMLAFLLLQRFWENGLSAGAVKE